MSDLENAAPWFLWFDSAKQRREGRRSRKSETQAAGLFPGSDAYCEAEERLNQGSPRQARREAPLSFLNVAQRRRPGIPIRDCSARTSPCSLRLVTGSVLLPRKAVVDRHPSLGRCCGTY